MRDEQIISGLPKIINNSKELLSDANLLYENSRFQRAYSLYQLSIEEIAKAFYLIGIVIFQEEERAKISRQIKSHKFKSKKSVGLEYLLVSFLKEINKDKYDEIVKDHILELNSVNEINEKKNHGFYVSIINNEFKDPSEIISPVDTKKIKNIAELRIWIGNKFLEPMLKNIYSITEQAQKINLKNSNNREEHISDLKRIIKKFGIQ